MRERFDRRGRLLVPAALFLLAGAAFAPSLGGGFLHWDDRGLLLETTGWRGFAPENLRWMVATFHAGHWQPLTWLSFAANHALGGLDPLGYRLGNLLLHGAAAVLFHRVLLRVLALALPRADGGPPGAAERIAAGLGALLFAVHPLRAESVAWITERRDVLSGALLLGALLAWLRAAEPGRGPASRRRNLAGAVALHALSLGAKAWGVTFPAVLVVLDAGPLRRLGPGAGGWFGRGTRPVWLEKVPFLLLAMAAAVVAPLAQREAGALVDLERLSVGGRLAVAAHGLVFYAGRTLLPMGLSPLYELPRPFDPAAPRFLFAGLAVLASAGSLFALRRRRPGWAAAGTLYALLLLPVLGLFQSGPQLAADRYSYLAGLPLAGLAGAGVLLAIRRGGVTARGIAGGAALATAILFVASLGQAALWRSDRALWERALEVDPAGPVAAENMGAVLMREGDPAGAERLFRRSLRALPGYTRARLDLASALRRQGREQESRAEVERALAEDPGNREARGRRALDLVRLGRSEEARAEFVELLAGPEPSPDWRRGLGLALAALGRPGEGLPHLRAALAADPGDGAHLDALATVLALGGDRQGAIRTLREHLRPEPSFGQARLVLGTLLAEEGDAEGALEQLREAVRLLPHHPEASWNLAMLLAREGRRDEAREVLEAKLRRTPWDGEAKRGLELLGENGR